MNSHIIRLTSKDTSSTIQNLSKSNPVIVDFCATWCGPCRKLSPLLEKAATDNKLTLLIADVDICKELANEYEVSGIPHVILFHGGKELMHFVGYDEGKLAEMVAMAKKLLNPFVGKGTAIGTKVAASSNTDTTPIPAEPTEDGDNVYEIMFKFNDKVFKRRFIGSNSIGEVKAFVRKEVNAGNISLFTPFPRKVYDNDAISIKEAGLSKREVLNVTLQ